MKFIQRSQCPACKALKFEKLLSLPFSDKRVDDFLRSNYGERLPYRELSCMPYEIRECNRCKLLWQYWILDAEGMRSLYEGWIPENESLDKKRRGDVSLFARYAREAEVIAALINRRPHEISVLDFGMGWGYWCRLVASFGYDVIGYELSQQRIEYARSMEVNAIGDLDFLLTSHFDFINCEQVFEHLPQPLETLQKLTNCLKPQGIIRISVPDGSGMATLLCHPSWRAGKDSLHPMEHINSFTHHCLLNLAELVGFERVYRVPPNVCNNGTSLYFRKCAAKKSLRQKVQIEKISRILSDGDVKCIIRAVGERTINTCANLLESQIDTGQIVTVGNTPFPETLAASFRAGIAGGKKWTLCIDADVLPFPGSISALVQEAEAMDESVLEVQALVFDRFFGGWRPAGVHLYRTCHLPIALELLKDLQDEIRPETSLLEKMAEIGYTWRQSAIEFGLHDFEQSPQDIYRKCFIHAFKHVDLIPRMLSYWRTRAQNHEDFVSALEGLAAGIAFNGKVELDANASCFGETLRQYGPVKGALKAMTIHQPQIAAQQEETEILAMGYTSPPVWDWIESDWAEQGGRRASIQRFVCSLLRHGFRQCAILGTGSAIRVFQWQAAALGIEISQVVPSAPLNESSPIPDRIPVITLDDSGRLVANIDGKNLVAESTQPQAELSPSESMRTYRRMAEKAIGEMLEQGVSEVLVYGAGYIGEAFFEVATSLGLNILAYLESSPNSSRTHFQDLLILTPEDGQYRFPGKDIVIASLASSHAMVRRLLSFHNLNDIRSGGIWFLG